MHTGGPEQFQRERPLSGLPQGGQATRQGR